jgi:hypothetical protein
MQVYLQPFSIFVFHICISFNSMSMHRLNSAAGMVGQQSPKTEASIIESLLPAQKLFLLIKLAENESRYLRNIHISKSSQQTVQRHSIPFQVASLYGAFGPQQISKAIVTSTNLKHSS